MARTEMVYLQGKCKWVKAIQPDEWNNWKVTLYPNEESLEKIRDLQAQGMRNVIKKDDDGYNVTFRRPTSKVFKGKVQGFAPPEVVDSTGNPLRGVLVGNGSDVTVKLEVYEHFVPGAAKAKAKAARWLALKVDHLVPFIPEKDFDDNQIRAVKHLDEQPPQVEVNYF